MNGYEANVDPNGENTDPDAVLKDIRELFASGGPPDFERLLELIMGLNVYFQKGGVPPRDWQRAFASETTRKQSTLPNGSGIQEKGEEQ